MATIKWNRSEDYMIESKCGRYAVVPLWNSSVKPFGYKARHYPSDGRPAETIPSFCGTQKEAKQACQWFENKKEGVTMEETYLGDGVYATWDGWHIWLDLRAQGPDKIALDPSVLDALQEFRDRVDPKV